MKNLWQKIQDVEPIIWIAWTMGILFVGGMVLFAPGCGIAEPVRKTVDTLNNTVQSVDQDGSGTISMMEILSYLIGYDMMKSGGLAGAKKGIQRFRNGRKRNDGTCSEGRDS